MEKEYLKMADSLVGEVFIDSDCLLSKALGEIADFSGYSKECRYIAHAINSHDELVAEVERLREHNKNMREAINRMSNVIWVCQEDQDYFHDNVAMTREQFIEQYCCFPHPEQK